MPLGLLRERRDRSSVRLPCGPHRCRHACAALKNIPCKTETGGESQRIEACASGGGKGGGRGRIERAYFPPPNRAPPQALHGMTAVPPEEPPEKRRRFSSFDSYKKTPISRTLLSLVPPSPSKCTASKAGTPSKIAAPAPEKARLSLPVSRRLGVSPDGADIPSRTPYRKECHTGGRAGGNIASC